MAPQETPSGKCVLLQDAGSCSPALHSNRYLDVPWQFNRQILGANAIVCPPSYSDGGDGSCYYNYSPMTRDNGYRQCALENSYLVDVPNAFQNSAVQQRAGYADFIWLGLTCLNNSVTSCEWDTGIPLTSSSYNNFNGGNPVVDDGPCVLMAVKTGKWYSADCSNYRAYIDCKYTPNIKGNFIKSPVKYF